MKLQSYQNEYTTMQYSRQFSNQAALDLIRQLHAELDQAGPCPEKLSAWLQEHHAAAQCAIKITANALDSAYIKQDIT